MKTESVSVQPTVRVILKSDTQLMDEVVVVGYGSAKKLGSVVGSVTTVNNSKIANYCGKDASAIAPPETQPRINGKICFNPTPISQRPVDKASNHNTTNDNTANNNPISFFHRFIFLTL